MSWDNQTGWWVVGVPYFIDSESKSATNRERKYIIGKNKKIEDLLKSTHLQLKTCNLERLTTYFQYQNIPSVLQEKETTVSINGIPIMIVENESIPLNEEFFTRARRNILKDVIGKNAAIDPIFSKDGMHPSVPSSTKKEKEQKFETDKSLDVGLIQSIIQKYNKLVQSGDLKGLLINTAGAATGSAVGYGIASVATGGAVPMAAILGWIVITLLPVIIYNLGGIMRFVFNTADKKSGGFLSLCLIPIFAILSSFLDIIDAYYTGKTVMSGLWEAIKASFWKLLSAFKNIIPYLMKFSQKLATLHTIKNCFYAGGQPLGPVYSANIQEMGSRLKNAAPFVKGGIRTAFSVIGFGTFTILRRAAGAISYGTQYIPFVNKGIDYIWNTLNNWEKSAGENFNTGLQELRKASGTVASVFDWVNYLLELPGSLFLMASSIMSFLGGFTPGAIVSYIGMYNALTVSAMGVTVGLPMILLGLMLVSRISGTLYNYFRYYSCVKEKCGQIEESAYQDIESSICMSDCWNAGVEGISGLKLPPGVLDELRGTDFGDMAAYKETIITSIDGINSYQTGTVSSFLAGQFRVNVYDVYAKDIVERAYEQHVHQHVEDTKQYISDVGERTKDAVSEYISDVGERTKDEVNEYISPVYDLSGRIIRAPYDGGVYVVDAMGNITYSIWDNTPRISLDFIQFEALQNYFISKQQEELGVTNVMTEKQMREIDDKGAKMFADIAVKTGILLKENEETEKLVSEFWDAIRQNSETISNPQYPDSVVSQEGEGFSPRDTDILTLLNIPMDSMKNSLSEQYSSHGNPIISPSITPSTTDIPKYEGLPREVQIILRYTFFDSYQKHIDGDLNRILVNAQNGGSYEVTQRGKVGQAIKDILEKHAVLEKQRDAEHKRIVEEVKKFKGEEYYKLVKIVEDSINRDTQRLEDATGMVIFKPEDLGAKYLKTPYKHVPPNDDRWFLQKWWYGDNQPYYPSFSTQEAEEFKKEREMQEDIKKRGPELKERARRERKERDENLKKAEWDKKEKEQIERGNERRKQEQIIMEKQQQAKEQGDKEFIKLQERAIEDEELMKLQERAIEDEKTANQWYRFW